MSKQTADDLRAARKLIERPECWTKETSARDSTGHRISARASEAVCWCAGAAPELVTDIDSNLARMHSALTAVLPDGFRGLSGLVAFNDAPTTTHADILALFDRAIATEEAAE